MSAGLLPGCRPHAISAGVIWSARAVSLIAAASLFNLAYVALLCPHDLSPDEAHYWDWSRHLDWCYYSKGPLVAWLVRGSCELFGTTAFAVRLPAVACGGLLLAGLWRLALNTFHSQQLGCQVVLFALTLPPVSAASVLMTIDPPFLACWAWAAVAVQKKRWVAAGVLVAVGTLAKYTMLLFPVCIGLLMLARPEWRTRRVIPFLSISLLGLVPLAVWNAAHDWIGVRHLLGHADNGGRAAPWYSPLAFVGGQAGLLLGVWFVAWAAAAWRWRPTGLFSTSPRRGEVGETQSSREGGGWGIALPPANSCGVDDHPHEGGGEEGRRVFTSPLVGVVDPGSAATGAGGGGLSRTPELFSSNIALLWWLSVPVFGVFLLASVRTSGQPNWPAAAWVSGFVLAAGWWLGRKPTRGRAWALTLLLGLALCLFLRWPDLVRPALAAVLPAPSESNPTPVRKLDPTARLTGWRTLASAVDRVRLEQKRRTGEEPVIATMAWTACGELGFYCDGHPAVYTFGSAIGDRASQYDLWRPNPVADAQAFAAKTFVYVGDELPAGVFDSLERVERVTHAENGVPLATWTVWVGRGYRGFARPAPSRY